GGLDGKIRFLTNITGLWLLQECKRNWDSEGKKYSYSDMAKMAESAERMRFMVNPSNPVFLSPCNMPEVIKKYCTENGQGQIPDDAAIVRCVIDSLAMCFRVKIQELEKLCSTKYEKVHIIGGGCQNRFLMQCAADYMRRDVIAGPVEATAIGNIMAQSMASGGMRSMSHGRRMVAESFPVETFKPSEISVEILENREAFFKRLG
nr:FGGY-family carbohydrate kinase [Victivallales bacterium]